jgi:hypothetical protein
MKKQMTSQNQTDSQTLRLEKAQCKPEAGRGTPLERDASLYRVQETDKEEVNTTERRVYIGQICPHQSRIQAH